jgi:hypothetical protein
MLPVRKPLRKQAWFYFFRFDSDVGACRGCCCVALRCGRARTSLSSKASLGTRTTDGTFFRTRRGMVVSPSHSRYLLSLQTNFFTGNVNQMRESVRNGTSYQFLRSLHEQYGRHIGFSVMNFQILATTDPETVKAVTSLVSIIASTARLVTILI